MSNKMLIDASHPEETRTVVTKGSRIEEFDFESEHKKQLKGNIYLARVTRVEPSLQAAFVEYGGNRHGFLAFSEIHPDYYQIPQADRQALLEAENHGGEEDEPEQDFGRAAAAGEGENTAGPRGRSRRQSAEAAEAESSAEADMRVSEYAEEEYSEDSDTVESDKAVDFVGVEDALEEVPARASRSRGVSWRDYKIQEVIKRRQILLVQIVKEERGNKGAALTTYLSLAGRYSVLMPNTPRGGGISRKITNAADRKRLKEIVKGLEVPKGMGVILRTAGAARTKTEVRRDYEYLMRLWENVRALTLTSIAPALVYEEGSLIKRSIRDLYNKDIDEILVAGERGYREAKDFMRMLMPSHAKFVQPYRDPTPIFARNGIEAQLDAMLQPEAGLKSGGYLVINQTEALVAIDVNSGRSTRENSVEETALQTNLEAAAEVARQLRLRDLAGLVVIDFIDMQEKRNIRAVEKRLKDCLKNDRARIQIGRISHFGLMEMSRQRIRASVLESTTQPCPHCFGTGYVRSQSSLALHVLRMIEEYLQRSSSHNIMVRTPVSTALYVLNHKRQALTELEQRFGLAIDIQADDTIGKEHLAIHKTSEAQPKEAAANEPHAVSMTGEWDAAHETEDADIEDEAEEISEPQESRRGRNGRNRRHGGRLSETQPGEQEAESADEPRERGYKGESGSREFGGEEGGKRRRRGRRGGRRAREMHERQLPAAEPVGDFAARFIAEAKTAHVAEQIHGQRDAAKTGASLPPAEPVGSWAAENEAGSHSQRRNAPRRRGRGGREPAEGSAAMPQAVNAALSAATGFEAAAADNSRQSAAELPKVEPVGGTDAAAGIKPAGRRRKPRANHSVAGAAENMPAKDADNAAPVAAADKAASRPAPAAEAENLDGSAPKPRRRQRPRPAESAAAAEPIVTSSADNAEAEIKVKKKGWWGRRSFF